MTETRVVEQTVVSQVTVTEDEVTVVALEEGATGPAGPAGPPGVAGDPGIEVGPVAPSDTDILWADTSEPGDAVVPVGGASGESLVKLSASDYDTGWGQPTPPVGTALGTSGTVDLNMATVAGSYQAVALTGDVTFTTSNRAAGRSVTLRLAAGGSSRLLTFPSWVFVGAAAPSTLAANKVGVLSVTFFDGTDALAVAAWAAEP